MLGGKHVARRNMELKQQPPWIYLLRSEQINWRDNEILKGRNPDPHIEKELVKAEVWPEKPQSVH
jgi:hypothetical protein